MFHKFAAIPKETPGYGTEACKRRGWLYYGDFDASNAVERIGKLVEYQLGLDNGCYNHIHLGIKMATLYVPRWHQK